MSDQDQVKPVEDPKPAADNDGGVVGDQAGTIEALTQRVSELEGENEYLKDNFVQAVTDATEKVSSTLNGAESVAIKDTLESRRAEARKALADPSTGVGGQAAARAVIELTTEALGGE